MVNVNTWLVPLAWFSPICDEYTAPSRVPIHCILSHQTIEAGKEKEFSYL